MCLILSWYNWKEECPSLYSVSQCLLERIKFYRVHSQPGNQGNQGIVREFENVTFLQKNQGIIWEFWLNIREISDKVFN